jgi:hypothetical protein
LFIGRGCTKVIKAHLVRILIRLLDLLVRIESLLEIRQILSINLRCTLRIWSIFMEDRAGDDCCYYGFLRRAEFRPLCAGTDAVVDIGRVFI